SRRRHTRFSRDWSSDVCSSDLKVVAVGDVLALSASDAERIGYSEHTASTLEEVKAWLGYSERDLIEVEISFAEQLSKFILHPVEIGRASCRERACKWVDSADLE